MGVLGNIFFIRSGSMLAQLQLGQLHRDQNSIKNISKVVGRQMGVMGGLTVTLPYHTLGGTQMSPGGWG